MKEKFWPKLRKCAPFQPILERKCSIIEDWWTAEAIKISTPRKRTRTTPKHLGLIDNVNLFENYHEFKQTEWRNIVLKILVIRWLADHTEKLCIESSDDGSAYASSSSDSSSRSSSHNAAMKKRLRTQ